MPIAAHTHNFSHSLLHWFASARPFHHAIRRCSRKRREEKQKQKEEDSNKNSCTEGEQRQATTDTCGGRTHKRDLSHVEYL